MYIIYVCKQDFLDFFNTSYYYAYTTCQLQGEDSQLKRISKKKSKGDDPGIPVSVSAVKKGTVAGAVALIIGTSIGSGILALPKRTSPAVTYFISGTES